MNWSPPPRAAVGEMVERVAKVIFEAEQSGLPPRVHRKPFDELDEASGVAQRYRSLARSAIAAMREPTSAMMHIGLNDPHGLLDEFVYKKTAETWGAMIDVALNGG